MSVLPVPGGPTKSAPRGERAPISVYLSGVLRKPTISCMDSLASSCPATSLKVTPVSSPLISLALERPRPPPNPPNGLPPPKFIEGLSSPMARLSARFTKYPATRKMRSGIPNSIRMLIHRFAVGSGMVAEKSTPLSCSVFTRSTS